MKFLFSISLSLLLSSSVFGQKNGKLTPKEMEIVNHFKNDYKKKNYKKFEGKITAKDNLVQFDDKIFYYDKNDKITVLLLKEGIIYPQLLTDYQMDKFLEETTDRTQKRFLKLQKDPRAGFDVNNTKLTNSSEATFLGTDPKIKRFKTLCKDSKTNNTLVYYFELTDKNATKETSKEEFIKNSKLTHIYQD